MEVHIHVSSAHSTWQNPGVNQRSRIHSHGPRWKVRIVFVMKQMKQTLATSCPSFVNYVHKNGIQYFFLFNDPLKFSYHEYFQTVKMTYSTIGLRKITFGPLISTPKLCLRQQSFSLLLAITSQFKINQCNLIIKQIFHVYSVPG